MQADLGRSVVERTQQGNLEEKAELSHSCHQQERLVHSHWSGELEILSSHWLGS